MSNSTNDLLIIGAGDLGRRLAALWLQVHPTARVIGETATTRSHASLSALGVTPRLANNSGGGDVETAHLTVFCVPPSRFDDYPAAIAAAAARVPPGGRFLLTSSSAVHGEVPRIDETSPPGDTPRATRLHAGERAALAHERGIVLRLSGLYFRARGPHSVLGPENVVAPGPEEKEMNLMHYDDAAAAVVAALRLDDATLDELRPDRCVFLAAVRHMMSMRALVDAAMRTPMLAGRDAPRFITPVGTRPPVVGRVYDSSWTREKLSWAPRWESYAAYVDDNGLEKESKHALARSVDERD